jgi:hypothetical protein
VNLLAVRISIHLVVNLKMWQSQGRFATCKRYLDFFVMEENHAEAFRTSI